MVYFFLISRVLSVPIHIKMEGHNPLKIESQGIESLDFFSIWNQILKIYVQI